MRRSLFLTLLGVAFIATGIVRAEAAGAPPLRVAYVDLMAVMADTTAGKQAQAKLQKELDKRQKNLDEKQQKAVKLEEQIQKQRAFLKADKLREKERELAAMAAEIQQLYSKLQAELEQVKQSAMVELLEKATPVINKIAKQQGFTMVFERTNSFVVWANDDLDITASVKERL